MPKSTPRLDGLAIQRKNIFIRLAAAPRLTSAICLYVRVSMFGTIAALKRAIDSRTVSSPESAKSFFRPPSFR